jgi:hypothetical protein
MVRALRQWHHAHDLCDKCAEKWVFGHKCALTVQLNALSEILELFSDDECHATGGLSPETEESDELCLCLFEADVLGKDSAMSMRMLGNI